LLGDVFEMESPSIQIGISHPVFFHDPCLKLLIGVSVFISYK